MPKIRVHELAKELNVTNKDIISKMGEYGKSISNHMSSLDDTDVSNLKKDLGKQESPPSPRPRPLGADGKPLPPRPRPLGADGRPLPPRPRPLGPDG
ncbi:MAG: translation initiation factor IF-2 N-terminal domain-containing protein, partial [Defluviitaleaceae bacterium]|nr:translation initiation factor IF-2 N-terminal domain-containing protein [Defluviitaleaceae bacterium]